jgi:hypothetical protein
MLETAKESFGVFAEFLESTYTFQIFRQKSGLVTDIRMDKATTLIV